MSESARFRPVAALMRRLGTLLPSSFQEGKLPYMFFFVSLMIALLLVYAVISPYPYATPMFLSFAAFLVLLLLLVHGGLSLAWAVHLGSAAAAVLLLYAIWVAGGSFSPRMTWLMVLPLTPFYVLGRKAGSVWLCIALFLQALIAALTGLEIWPALALGSEHAFSSWVTATAATGVLVIVPLLYARMYQSALAQGMRDQAALELKKKELEHALLMREHFVATVSHELRTPMNAILGFNALLLSRLEGHPNARKVLNHTQQSADHLMTVINDILDYSQLEAGELVVQQERFELRQTVTHAFELFWPRVKSMDIDYHMALDDDLPVWVCSDRHRLMQVLVNFLGNALKFTHQGAVTLRVQWQNPGVLFSVKDTGIGIAPERQAQVFNRFSQAEDDTQALYGGNGLGLAISRRLAQLLGGEIGFESEPGKGSRFWLQLPLKAESAPLKKGAAAAKLQTAQMPWRFLIADDHPVNRLLVQQVLKNAWPHCQTVEVGNGLEALNALQQQAFDLVLMDMVMPVMDGIVATQKLRQEWPAPACHLPVIGLTANVNPVDLVRFKAAGLSDVMLKPFEPEWLCLRVEQWLLQRT
ncbi:ATP-binding protein [Limnohabitans sp.]|jgi:signal transduction histidine kinase/CheY-like chemotaxis protein|uniref:ATP-binding protein n=1 Tax=Limnohabitans sp. TaxID=1907725 RepID=UPI0037C0A523